MPQFQNQDLCIHAPPGTKLCKTNDGAEIARLKEVARNAFLGIAAGGEFGSLRMALRDAGGNVTVTSMPPVATAPAAAAPARTSGTARATTTPASASGLAADAEDDIQNGMGGDIPDEPEDEQMDYPGAPIPPPSDTPSPSLTPMMSLGYRLPGSTDSYQHRARPPRCSACCCGQEWATGVTV